MTITRIGVVGSGPLGQAFARALGRAGVAAVIGASGLEGLSPLIGGPDGMVSAATLRQATEEDIVFLSVAWSQLGETLAAVADWESRILIDATNAILPGAEVANLGGKTSSEIVSDLPRGPRSSRRSIRSPPKCSQNRGTPKGAELSSFPETIFAPRSR